MRRTALKRGAPPKRSKMKRRKPRARSGSDPAYLRWIRKQPCCVCGKAPPNHAHHVTGAGLALKASDRDTMPLCADCHRDLHEFTGFFAGKSREFRAVWQKLRVKFMHARREREAA